MKIIKNREGDTLELDDMTPEELSNIVRTCKNLSQEGSHSMKEIAENAFIIICEQFPEYGI